MVLGYDNIMLIMISDRGRLFSFGSNIHGQLGTGGSTTAKPTIVEELSAVRVAAIAAGNHHSCAITAYTGTLYTWGANARYGRCIFNNSEHQYRGQLGLGTKEMQPLPQPVLALRKLNIVFVACGSQHTVALTGIFTVLVNFS